MKLLYVDFTLLRIFSTMDVESRPRIFQFCYNLFYITLPCHVSHGCGSSLFVYIRIHANCISSYRHGMTFYYSKGLSEVAYNIKIICPQKKINNVSLAKRLLKLLTRQFCVVKRVSAHTSDPILILAGSKYAKIN